MAADWELGIFLQDGGQFVQGLLLDCHLPDVEDRKVLATDPCLSIGQHFVICIKDVFCIVAKSD
jgi:hypothetical protein